MTAASHGQDCPPAIIAVGSAACAAWDDFTAGGSICSTTRSLYRQAALRFLRWLESQDIGLAQVTPCLVERHLEELHVSRSSKTTYRTGIRRLLDALVAHHAIPPFPTTNAQAQPDNSLPPLAEMKAAIRELDPAGMDDAPDMLDAGVVLLAGLHLGTKNLKRLSRFTGVAPEHVAIFAERLRANGVWTCDGRTAGMWDQEGGEIALLLDILIAVGLVECCPAGAESTAAGSCAVSSPIGSIVSGPQTPETASDGTEERPPVTPGAAISPSHVSR